MTLAFLQAVHGALPAGGPVAATGAIGWVWLAVVLPFAGFLVNGALALWRPQAKSLVSLVGPGVLVGAFAVAVAAFLQLRGMGEHGAVTLTLWSWLPVGRLQVDAALRVDQLAAVMLLVVTGVGSLIHLFSVGYMRADEGYARYFAYLNLFVAFMLVLVLGANFPVLFVGWEGVGLCSYLLIGFWYSDTANADAGKKAFIMNRIGDFGFLVAAFMTFWWVGTLDFAEVAARAPHTLAYKGAVVTTITLFLFLACTGKSAQIPLYTWLPDAMAGPTPVSALIHAATMVTAGVYLVARTGVLFSMAPFTGAVVAGVGALTALLAATIGLKQYDIKKVLAYSTVSQLGYMFLAVGAGAYVAGIFHLVTHAFFKALLFLGSGSVIHAMHHAYHASHAHEDAQDMRNMGGLRKWMPWTWGLMWVATLAIAGIFPFSGFFSKDEILALVFGRGKADPYWYVLWAMGVAAAALTAFYMARLMAMTFHGDNRTGEAERAHLHEAPWSMTGPLVVLGVLSAVGGLISLPALVGGHHWLETWLHPVLAEASRLLPVELPPHGVELALVGVASLVAVAGLVFGFRRTLSRPIPVARVAPPETGLGRLLHRKYFVDEIYDTVIVRPLLAVSRSWLWRGIDAGVIDGFFVNGAARASRALGRVGSRLQTGQVSAYLLLFLVGALWVLRVVTR
jgi:NADH-quinone oxidoreductase subunit L